MPMFEQAFDYLKSPAGNANLLIGALHTAGNANLPIGALHTPGNANLPIGALHTAGNANLPIGGLITANQEIGVPGIMATRESGVPRDGRDADGFGWYNRGYLPHFDGREVIQHVTFHLADSLPKDVVTRLEEELRVLPPAQQDVERRKRVEALIDAGYGSCVLREPAVAQMVQGSLLHFDGQRYRLFAWVVMPNHVHVLFQPLSEWTVAKIVASWKKFTATRICAFRRMGTPGNANLPIGGMIMANQEIGAPGIMANREIGGPGEHVWHRECWDRYIRDECHFQQTVEYIHQNPVKVGLVAKAEDWRWSSAGVYANREIGEPGGER
ncbi:MAG: transposase [Armatimonadota bacterium]